jgi:hypothetical protein
MANARRAAARRLPGEAQPAHPRVSRRSA